MTHSIKHARRKQEEYLTPLGFEYVGSTSGAHLRWRHTETGRLLTTVSDMRPPRALNNMIRSAKKVLRGDYAP